MIDIAAFSIWLKQRQAYLRQQNTKPLHRRMVLIAPALGKQVFQTLAKNINNALFLSQNSASFASFLNAIPKSINTFQYVETAKYRTILGTEVEHCIVDARDGINLDALIAVSGVVKSSGLLFIVLPASLETLPSMQNTGIAHSYQGLAYNTTAHFYFFALFNQIVQKHHIMHVDQQSASHSASLSASHTASVTPNLAYPQDLSVEAEIANVDNFSRIPLNSNLSSSSNSSRFGELKGSFTLSEQQQKIVDNLSDNDCRVHILLGKRGRGKSTTLAECCLQLSNTFKVYVCAPKQSQICAFQQHIDNLVSTNSLSFKQDDAIYTFLAPDQALEVLSKQPRAGLSARPCVLLVDEVASIAPSLLRKLMRLANKTVLAGTTQGYEGSGQGFIQRVIPFIQKTYTYQMYELTESFRWFKNDPIEYFFEDLLLLNHEKDADELTLMQQKNQKSKHVLHKSKIAVMCLEKSELLTANTTRESVFTLLREAHYQTTPNDIVRLLDDPAYSLVVARDMSTPASTIVALAILIKEGGEILTPVADAIAVGKRRIQGHLTPQSLALYFLDKQWCMYTGLRINRIAVKPKYRRQGIASSILAFCDELAKFQDINYLSTSFGVNQDLYQFWHSNTFSAVKVGNRVDTSSGTISLLMLKNVSLKHWQETKESIEKQLALEMLFHQQVTGSVNIAEVYDITSKHNTLDKPLADYLLHIKTSLQLLVNQKVELNKLAANLWYFISCYQQMCKQNSRVENMLNEHDKLIDDYKQFFAKGTHKKERDNIALRMRLFCKENLWLLDEYL